MFILSLLLMCMSSRRRARHGRQPIYGTAWMIPPTYHQSQQEYSQQSYGGAPAAPPYGASGYPVENPGHYDTHGNWVPAYNGGAAPGGYGDASMNGGVSQHNSGPVQQPPQTQQAQYEYNNGNENNYDNNTSTHNTGNANEVSEHTYAPPPGPPPMYGGSSSSEAHEMSNLPVKPDAVYNSDNTKKNW